MPEPAPWCPLHLDFEYAVPPDARACTPLRRSGNAVYRETGIEASNPSRSGFVMSQAWIQGVSATPCASSE
jgi:hypothetical protein